jgi:hypothetical protein
MELMKRLNEINGFICEARARLEELEGDCQNEDLDAQAEIVWDWLARLEPIETEIDEFTEEWRKIQESKIQIKSITHDELFNMGSPFPDSH